MIYKHLFLTAILFLGTFVNGHTGNYTKSGNTVTVNVESPGERGAKTVRLQVIGDKIVRVEATPETSFPEKQSLIVVPQKANTRFTVTQQGDDITVSTRQVRAVVSSRTGHVAFYDADGRLLLGETARDGKPSAPSPYRNAKLAQAHSPTDSATAGRGTCNLTRRPTKPSTDSDSIRRRNST